MHAPEMRGVHVMDPSLKAFALVCVIGLLVAAIYSAGK